MIPPVRTAALGLALLLLGGCAAVGPQSANDVTPRTRCLDRPAPGAPGGSRPLVFFLCIQSP